MFSAWHNNLLWARASHCRGFTIIFRHTTLGRNPMDLLGAQRTDLYLTAHNTHNRQTSMFPAGFESAISASERPQTHALPRAVTGIGMGCYNRYISIAHILILLSITRPRPRPRIRRRPCHTVSTTKHTFHQLGFRHKK
jgi:hypothetical protein